MTVVLGADDGTYENDATVSGAPAFELRGRNVTLLNRDTGRIVSTSLSAPAIDITGFGGRIENGEGASIEGFSYSSIAIRGSAGDEVVVNAGLIKGLVRLGDGSDTYTQQSYIFADVGLEGGDDTLRYEAIGSSLPTISGGDGFDTVVLPGAPQLLNAARVTGFERLELSTASSNSWNLVEFSGFSEVSYLPGSRVNFLQSVNPSADLTASGGFVTVGPGSVFRNVTGSGGGDIFELNGGSIGSVDLGLGNDAFWYSDWQSTPGAPAIAGTVDGGGGTDMVNLSVDGGITVDLTKLVGFETINTGTFTSFTSDVRLTGLNGYSQILVDNGGRLVLADSHSPGAAISVFSARVELEATATVGAIGLYTFGEPTESSPANPSLSITVVNAGTVLGDVKLTTGNDIYDGRLGTVGGIIQGYAGHDVIEAGAGDDTIFGGSGNDLIDGGAGSDELHGGVGVDTISYASALSGVRLSLDFQNGSDAQLTGGGGTDLLTGFENLTGSDFRDVLIGDEGNNVISGGAGRDEIIGAEGNDTLDGGDGIDIAYYNYSEVAGVSVSLAISGPQDTGGAGVDTLTNIEDLVGTRFNDTLTGNAGANALLGLAGNDILYLTDGGDDQAFGGDGDDGILFGATLTSADSVDAGGGANDQVGIRGDYTGANALTLGANTLVNVEVLVVQSGGDYQITAADATVAAGTKLTVYSGTLAAADSVTFDGSAESDGFFVFYGGAGTETLTGGASDDGFYFGQGNFAPTDTIVAGAGNNDQLGLDGDYALTLGGNYAGIDVLVLYRGEDSNLNDYDITLSQAAVEAGKQLTIYAVPVVTDLRIDASAVTNGSIRLLGGGGRDTVTGGALADTILGLGGDDLIRGGGGGDNLEGGVGADLLIYGGASESTGINYDRLIGFDAREDRIDLPVAITGFDAAVSQGSLSTASFDADLAAAFAGLEAGTAGMFNPDAGDFAGRSFLVADGNGVAGYQAGEDYVFELIAPPVPLGPEAVVPFV